MRNTVSLLCLVVCEAHQLQSAALFKHFCLYLTPNVCVCILQAVPRPHRWSQLYRHLQRRHQAVDRRPRQHGPLLGSERGTAAAAARLHVTGTRSRLWTSSKTTLKGFKLMITSGLVPDLLSGLLSDGRVACCRNGEQQCGGPSCHQAWQIPAASTWELRSVSPVCLLWWAIGRLQHTVLTIPLTLWSTLKPLPRKVAFIKKGHQPFLSFTFSDNSSAVFINHFMESKEKWRTISPTIRLFKGPIFYPHFGFQIQIFHLSLQWSRLAWFIKNSTDL